MIKNQSLKEKIYINLNKEFSNINIYTYKTIPSTNEIAKQLVLNEAKHGTVIIAEEQTSGKGRMGKSFYSPPNTGIYMSIILRENLSALNPVLITTSSCVAICDAIYNKKKVGGILAETSIDFKNKNMNYLIIGIGINFNKPKFNFPTELKEIAGAIYQDNNTEVSKNKLCSEIINNILNIIPKINNYDFILEYKKRSLILNKEILYIINNIKYKGKAIDINKDGYLIVKHNDGSIKTLNSSEITIRMLN